MQITFLLSLGCYRICEGTGFNSIDGQHPDVICGCRMESTQHCCVLLLLNPEEKMSQQNIRHLENISTDTARWTVTFHTLTESVTGDNRNEHIVRLLYSRMWHHVVWCNLPYKLKFFYQGRRVNILFCSKNKTIFLPWWWKQCVSLKCQ
jgi:hypothetical protein